MVGRIQAWTRKFARAQDGVSAVEFALVAPLLILFYFGLAELTQGYMAQRRVDHAAAAVADLIAQNKEVYDDDLEDIFLVGGLTMEPFPGDALKLRVSSVVADAQGVAKVEWSDAQGMAARSPDEIVTLPAGLLTAGASVVMAEAEYDYAPATGMVMPALTRFKHTYYLAPRLSQKVIRKEQ